LGRVHHHWLDRLWQADHPRNCDLGAEYLLTSNAWTHVLNGHDDQHALAHPWVLVHYLMSAPTVRAGLLAYLRACGRPHEPPPRAGRRPATTSATSTASTPPSASTPNAPAPATSPAPADSAPPPGGDDRGDRNAWKTGPPGSPATPAVRRRRWGRGRPQPPC